MKDSKSAPVQPVRIGFEAIIDKNDRPKWIVNWGINAYQEWEAKMAKCKGKGKKKGK